MKGLDLSNTRVEILIKEMSTGELLELKQTFRRPTDEEWLDYERGASELVYRNGRIEQGHKAAAELKLWETCVVSVDSYIWNDAPLSTLPDWKMKIPVSHKCAAIRELVWVRAEVVTFPLA